jgi:ectoine hydroxylase-related dioxygenase (phytanoyl-CoA dioxygenase family)
MPDIPRFTRNSPATDIVEALREFGVAIIERLVDDTVCDAVQREMQPYIDATPNGSDEFSGLHTTRTGALLARSTSSQQMVAHPLVLEVADAFLWEKKTSFQLHLTQVIAIGPNSPAQALHRDQWCFDFFPFPDDVEVELSSIWAMHDFTEENGATRVIPGSHREGNEVLAEGHRAVSAAMPKGSVVLYSGRTVHGGGNNRSDRTRTALNVDYVLGWLRQEENQYLSVPPEIARTLPEHVQRLAGYQLGAYALGYVDDTRDPQQLLHSNLTNSTFGGVAAVQPNLAAQRH